MGNGFELEFKPNKANAEAYAKLYKQYGELGDFIEKQTSKK
jgi:L-ribulokinase